MSYSGLGQAALSIQPFVLATASPDAWRPLVKAAATDLANAISRIPASERLLSVRKDKWATLQTQLLFNVAAKAMTPTVTRERLAFFQFGPIPAGIPAVGTLPANASPTQIRLQAERAAAAPFIASVQSKYAALMVLLNPAQAAIDAAAAQQKAATDLQAARDATAKAAADQQMARDQQTAIGAAIRLAAANEVTRLAAVDKAAADQQAAQAAAAAAIAATPLPVHVGPMPDGKLPPTTPYTTTPPRIEIQTVAEPPFDIDNSEARFVPPVIAVGPATIGPLVPAAASPGPLGVSWMVWGIGAAALVGGYFMMGRKTTPNRRRVRRNRRRHR